MSPPAKNVPSPIASSVTTAASLPSVPAVETSTGLRTIVLPGDLVTWFLAIAKSNSDQNIETLGTFGVQLCNNKFLVTSTSGTACCFKFWKQSKRLQHFV